MPRTESARRHREHMRRLLAESITESEVLAVKTKLLDLAMDGDLEAIKEFLNRAAGRPMTAEEDADEGGAPKSLHLHFDLPPALAERWDNPPPPRTIDVEGTKR